MAFIGLGNERSALSSCFEGILAAAGVIELHLLI